MSAEKHRAVVAIMGDEDAEKAPRNARADRRRVGAFAAIMVILFMNLSKL